METANRISRQKQTLAPGFFACLGNEVLWMFGNGHHLRSSWAKAQKDIQNENLFSRSSANITDWLTDEYLCNSFSSSKHLQVCLKLTTNLAGTLLLTDRFAGVELGIAVSRYMSLFYRSQCIQLVFDDVLTLCHTKEALPFSCRGKQHQKQRVNLWAAMLNHHPTSRVSSSGQYCSGLNTMTLLWHHNQVYASHFSFRYLVRLGIIIII